jgi:Fic family protein
MRTDDFTSAAPGSLVAIGGGIQAYRPAPLPPVLTLSLAESRVLSEAEHALGELSGAGSMLPNPDLLIRPFLRREAVLSSRIEGTIATIGQLALFEGANAPESETGDVREVFNYLAALDAGFDSIAQGYPISNWLMRQLHKQLMTNVRGSDQSPGSFRVKQNAIGVRGRGFDHASYIPPPPTDLPELLGDLERFIQQPAEMPVLAQIALVHYQFEAIHPFMDGNGRIGRLLIALLLCQYGVLSQPLLYLSDYFERNRDEYIYRLLSVSQRGEWNEWISFFATGVAEQARDARERAKALLDLWQSYRRRIQASGHSSRTLTLVDWLFDRPTLTVTRAAQGLEVTPRAAGNLVEKLVQAGILTEITGRPRYRMFVANEILELTERRTATA